MEGKDVYERAFYERLGIDFGGLLDLQRGVECWSWIGSI